MKYFKRQQVYKASNCVYNPLTKESTSYGWWLVSRVVKGVLLFNSYSYSVSTSKHQGKIRNMLEKAGNKIDLFVQAPDGLQNLNSALEYHKNLARRLAEQIVKPKTRKAKNVERLQEITRHVAIINKLQELIKD